ncbi:MAG: histidine kinase dimerization/phospho-acceptor domain-containing protein [Thermonemataceae bacterium]|nr:histidine kinase dimerization/phospho-acceptor domain-containing protein [Thermonemataceae bacterium]
MANKESIFIDKIPSYLIESKLYFIVLEDLEGNYLFVNDFFRAKLKLPEVLCNEKVVNYILSEDYMKYKEALENCMKEEYFRVEIRKFNKYTKEIYYIEWELVNLRDEKNNIVGILRIGYDVTNFKLKEKKLSKQSEALFEIARKQSHEVRRPLANILGICSLLQDDSKLSEKERSDYIKYLKQSSEELDEMIHSIVRLTNTYF